MSPQIAAFLSVVVISLISFIGVFTISLKAELLKRYVFVLVSLAVGALIGDAFIHLIPHSYADIGDPTLVSILVIIGIFVFFLIEKLLHWHHHGLSEENDLHKNKPVGRMILISDGLHNFIDGLIIGVSYMVSFEVGIATTLAVILHEIPQEIGDFGVLIHSGFSKLEALKLNFYSALLAVAGVILALIIGESSESFALFIVPLAAGGFIYVAIADLMPELHKQDSRRSSDAVIQLAAAFVGVLAMVMLLGAETGHNHDHGHGHEVHEVEHHDHG